MDGNMLGSTQRSRGLRLNWLFVAVALLVLILGAKFLFGDKIRNLTLGASSEYQSVFLTNGQVYFGKLGYKNHWLVLTDVYYLQVSEDLQKAGSGDQNSSATPSNNQNQNQKIQLVKLGSELHGPEDTMYIAKDKILFWENMKSDSKVLQSIKQYQGQ